MTLEIEAAEPITERRARATVASLQRPSPPQDTPVTLTHSPPPPSPANLEARHAAMLGVFETIALLVSARVLLLLSILGAFTLALLAILGKNLLGLEVMVGFAVLVVLPVVWLERFARVEGKDGS